ncbi:MAG: MFS transporter [Chloroflexi bacterium]|nr:MFS transporter [Chloroflexota bacterium]
MKTKPSPSMSSFWLLWSGQAISLFGSQLVQFALIWWLTQKTGSGTVLSTAVLVGIVPQVVLGPIIGALVDRWNRQRILFMADTAVAFASLFLAVLFGLGIAEIWHVFAILFVRALGGAFHGPTMMTSTALMVPPEQLTRIQGVNQTLQAGLTVVSAPLGALLLGGIGVMGMLVLDAVTAVFAILPLFFIAIPQPPKEPIQDKKPSLWREIGAGMRYVWIRPGLLGLIGMAALINFLLMPAMSLVPLLVQTHFNGGAMQYAILESMIGLGALAGGVSLGVWGWLSAAHLHGFGGHWGDWRGGAGVSRCSQPSVYHGRGGHDFYRSDDGLGEWLAGGHYASHCRAELSGAGVHLAGHIGHGHGSHRPHHCWPCGRFMGVHFWLVTGGLMCLGMAVVGFASTHVRNVEQVGVEVETAVAL